jgi:hypothetical protein
MRFAPQTIPVTDNKGRTYSLAALVAVQDDSIAPRCQQRGLRAAGLNWSRR